MASGTAVPTMGRKRSESRKYNTLVRMDDEVCAKGKKLAALRGVSMAELFSDILGPILDEEWAKEVTKEAELVKKPPRKKADQ